MRIAIVTPGFSRSADDWAIPFLQSYVSALAATEEAVVFSLRYPESGIYPFPGFTHIATGGGQRYRFHSITTIIKCVHKIIQAHSQKRIDILHAFWADEPGFAAILAGRLIHRPVVVTLSGGELVYLPEIDYGTQRSIARRKIIDFTLGNAAKISAGSRHQIGAAVSHGVPEKKLNLIFQGVDLRMFGPVDLLPLAQPTLVQAASLTPIKNQRLLLDVLQKVSRALPDVKLIVAGDGPQKTELHDYAKHLGLFGSVSWLSAVPHSEISRIYQQGHVYVQSSLNEALGMSVLEAQACGLPVIGTPVGILPEICDFEPSWDAGTLASQVMALFESEEGYVKLRANALRRVSELFTLEDTVRNFVSWYQQTCSLVR